MCKVVTGAFDTEGVIGYSAGWQAVVVDAIPEVGRYTENNGKD